MAKSKPDTATNAAEPKKRGRPRKYPEGFKAHQQKLKSKAPKAKMGRRATRKGLGIKQMPIMLPEELRDRFKSIRRDDLGKSIYEVGEELLMDFIKEKPYMKIAGFKWIKSGSGTTVVDGVKYPSGRVQVNLDIRDHINKLVNDAVKDVGYVSKKQFMLTAVIYWLEKVTHESMDRYFE